MKFKNKILIIIIIGIVSLFSLLIGTNYAENEITNETTGTENSVPQDNNTQNEDVVNNNTDTSNTTTENTTKNEVQEVTKSSNANLSNLGITPHDFKGFKHGTTYYEVAVPEDIESVEVYAKTQDEKATLVGTGWKKLEKGENKVEVIVTAEDGTTKTYTINIIREIQQEEDGEVEQPVNIEDGNGLLDLKFENLTLEPEFSTNVYEYTLKYIGKETKLNIETKPTSENYIVEIIGNDNLEEGENIITILVSEKNGDNVATYQITVNKSLEDYEAIAREQARKEKTQKIIIGIVIAVVVIGIIVFVIIRRRRNKNFAEEYSGIGFYAKQDENDMPKALREEKEDYTNNDFIDEELDYEEERKIKHKGKRFK